MTDLANGHNVFLRMFVKFSKRFFFAFCGFFLFKRVCGFPRISQVVARFDYESPSCRFVFCCSARFICAAFMAIERASSAARAASACFWAKFL